MTTPKLEDYRRLRKLKHRPPSPARLMAMIQHYRAESDAGADEYLATIQDSITTTIHRTGVNIRPYFMPDILD